MSTAVTKRRTIEPTLQTGMLARHLFPIAVKRLEVDDSVNRAQWVGCEMMS